MDIAISTLAFLGQSVSEVLKLGIIHNYFIEFSSGLPYHKDMETLFLAYPNKKLAHNYFPAPEVPFVLNLASKNTTIRQQSIAHCINGLHLSKKVGAPFFSAHAGFCIDPQPNDLGKQLSVNEPFDKNLHWDLFLHSINEILIIAKQLDVKFLIENNVIAKMNLTDTFENPLFCTDTNEILKLYHAINNTHFGILLDTAHFKVSANTLNFDLESGVEQIKQTLHCIHHSDNNGLLDTNDPLPLDYWFKPHLPLFKGITHVLEVKKLSPENIQQQLNILLY